MSRRSPSLCATANSSGFPRQTAQFSCPASSGVENMPNSTRSLAKKLSLFSCLALFATNIGPIIPTASGDGLPIRPPDAPQESHLHWRHPLSCGVTSCYVLLRLLASPVTYDDCAHVIPITDHGSNMLDMKRGCEVLGLRVEVVMASPSELDGITFPVIAHVFPAMKTWTGTGHFVILLGINEHRVCFFEPSSTGAQYALRGDFARAWSGALLVPDRHIASSPNERLVLPYIVCAALVASIALSSIQWVRSRWRPPGLWPVLRAVGPIPLLLYSITGCSPIADNKHARQNLAGGFELVAWKV